MKAYILLFILCNFVSANSGYYPVSILSKDYNSFSYCEYNKPCRYLNNNTIEDKFYQKILKDNDKNNAFLFSILGFILLMLCIITVCYTSIKILYKKI